ncbi:MAG: alpha/beta hydrolase [Thermoplasmata archaeon]
MPMRSVPGGEIYYELHGSSGDPTVLVHGSWVDHHSWDAVVPGFAQALEVVVYDRRGYGASPVGPRVHSVRDDAADLAALLESLNVYPAHVIAHSYGGAVALRLATERPEMVRSLALHEPPFLGLLVADPATVAEGDELTAGVRELQRLVRAGESERAAQRLTEVFSTETGAWQRLSPEVQRSFVGAADLWAAEFDDPEALLPEVTSVRDLMIPVLLTVGTRSPRFLHRITQDLAHLLRNSQVVEIPGVGHVPHLSQPHQYVGLLVTFLLERNVPGS